MSWAVQLALKKSKSVLVLGTDCPVMDSRYLLDAIEKLDAGIPVVLGPAEDGGYLLLGLNRNLPELFVGIDWGTSKVLNQTRKCLYGLGVEFAELDTLWDLDRPQDLVRFQREISGFKP